MILTDYQQYLLYLIDKYQKNLFITPRQIGGSTVLYEYVYNFIKKHKFKNLYIITGSTCDIYINLMMSYYYKYKNNIPYYNISNNIIKVNNNHIYFISNKRQKLYNRFKDNKDYDLIIVDNYPEFMKNNFADKYLNDFFPSLNDIIKTKIILMYSMNPYVSLSSFIENYNIDYEISRLLNFFPDINIDIKTNIDIEKTNFLRKYKLEKIFEL